MIFEAHCVINTTKRDHTVDWIEMARKIDGTWRFSGIKTYGIVGIFETCDNKLSGDVWLIFKYVGIDLRRIVSIIERQEFRSCLGLQLNSCY